MSVILNSWLLVRNAPFNPNMMMFLYLYKMGIASLSKIANLSTFKMLYNTKSASIAILATNDWQKPVWQKILWGCAYAVVYM